MAEVLTNEEIKELLTAIESNDPDTMPEEYRPDNNNESFKKEFYEILKRALFLLNKVFLDGWLSLEDCIDRDKADSRYILDYGLSFVIDGTDAPIIDKILTNIIKQEKDEVQFKLKMIMKEAVMAIHGYMNLHLLVCLLNSYTDIPLDDPEFVKIADDAENDRRAKQNRCNIGSFSDFIDSFKNIKLSIIGSNPGKGKTWLVLTIAKYLACYLEKPIAFISLNNLVKTLHERLSKINCDKLLKIKRDSDFINYSLFNIIDNPKIGFADVEQYIRDLHSKKKVEFVFIDSINEIIMDVQDFETTEKEHAKMLIKLKELAEELNISIIVTMQEHGIREVVFYHLLKLNLYFDEKNPCADNLIIIPGLLLSESLINIYKYSENKDWLAEQIKWAFPL